MKRATAMAGFEYYSCHALIVGKFTNGEGAAVHVTNASNDEADPLVEEIHFTMDLGLGCAEPRDRDAHRHRARFGPIRGKSRTASEETSIRLIGKDNMTEPATTDNDENRVHERRTCTTPHVPFLKFNQHIPTQMQ